MSERSGIQLRSATGVLTALLALAACTSAPAPTAAPAPAAARVAAPKGARIEYEIRFPNAVHHEAEVSATFRGVPTGRPLAVQMSRSSPGRYALHEFAKNVYSVRAFDGAGRELQISRANPSQWSVSGHDGTVRVTYTLFGDRVDGTYVGIDATHAHLNMPGVFMWAHGLEEVPITVAFHKPVPTWSIATQLFPTADSLVYSAPNLQYFLDSPAEIGPISWRSWQIAGERPATVKIAMHHLGTEQELDEYARMVEKVTAEQAALFGGLPSDRGVYTFLIDYLPWANGDGMEHRNSTVVTSSGALATSARQLLGTISHEFFHQWNVERIRPKSLEPFDFADANMSGDLWFAEGFTSYYTDLFLRRAGLRTDAEYARAIGGHVNALVVMPGRLFASPIGMSQEAPFVDAAVSVDPTNRGNTFISYYTYGAALGLALDLSLRERFDNVTLDDYFRALWNDYGRYQSAALAPERPYGEADLKRVLGEVTGDAAFAEDFFRRYVESSELPDYERLLAPAGYLLRTARPGQAWIGPVQVIEGAVVTGATMIGSPLYQAGLDRGDRIVSLDGKPVRSVEDLEAIARAKPFGTAMPIVFTSRAGERSAAVTWVENPAVEVVPFEAAGLALTPEMQAFRASWLGSRVGR